MRAESGGALHGRSSRNHWLESKYHPALHDSTKKILRTNKSAGFLHIMLYFRMLQMGYFLRYLHGLGRRHFSLPDTPYRDRSHHDNAAQQRKESGRLSVEEKYPQGV
jgi:hypothetical protein